MRAGESNRRNRWSLLTFSLVHATATLAGLFIVFYAGQQAVDFGGQPSAWLNVVGAAVVAMTLPIVYPLLSLEWLRPQGLDGLFALVAVCLANSMIVAVGVRWFLDRIAMRRLLRRQ